jgi:hypothetical protein
MVQHLLKHHDFLEAVWIYDQAIKKMTCKTGVPKNRSVTKTLAYMSLIVETGKAQPKRL